MSNGRFISFSCSLCNNNGIIAGTDYYCSCLFAKRFKIETLFENEWILECPEATLGQILANNQEYADAFINWDLNDLKINEEYIVDFGAGGAIKYTRYA